MTLHRVTDEKTETQNRKENCSRLYNKLEQDRNNPIEVNTELEMGKKPSGGSFVGPGSYKIGCPSSRKRIQNYRYRIARTVPWMGSLEMGSPEN